MVKKDNLKKSKFLDKSKPKEKILKILEGSTKFKMEVARVILRFEPEFLSKFLVDTLDDVEKGKILQVSQGTKVIVVLCEENFAQKIKKKYKSHVINVKKDLVAYTIMFPKVGGETHGVLSFITTMLAENKINLFEVISTYTDITFLIKRKDLFKVMELLGQFVV